MKATYSDLEGKVAIVTGAGRSDGIGFSIARQLSENGVRILLGDLPEDLSTDQLSKNHIDCVDTLRDLNPDVHGVALNVTSRESIDQAVESAIENFGKVDILINNAGIGRGSGDYLELTDEDWSASIAVNLKGVADFCQSVIPQFKLSGGTIVNVASLSGLGAIEAIPACYTATKFGVVGLTKAIALQYANQNIRCNALCPGVVETGMRVRVLELLAEQNGSTEDEARKLEDASIPMGRASEPQEIAAAACFLASSASSYLTGAALPVAGGLSQGL